MEKLYKLYIRFGVCVGACSAIIVLTILPMENNARWIFVAILFAAGLAIALIIDKKGGKL